jgi:SNF2 family DNA or RNA helicase
MGLTPRPYQIAGRDFLASHSRALLADEMRVGKTPQAILAADKLGAKSVLVLCPAIAVSHWWREWAKWYDMIGADVPALAVLSYDKARTLWRSGDLKSKRWDVFIPDEAHFCKNPEAARTQMVYGKGGLGYQAGAIWALSGTPAPKHAGELWPMLRAFGVTDMSYDAFVYHYCSGYWDKWSREWRVTGTREDRIPELREMLATVMLRRTRKEVAPDMPEIDFQFLEVDPVAGVDISFPPALFADDDALLAALEANPQANREDRQAVALAKVKPLTEEIAFAIENELLKQTVVFGWHVEPLQTLAWQLNQRGIRCEVITGDTTPKKRGMAQTTFRKGETKVIVANILAAGTAIDLSAASHGYFLELDWVSSNNVQAANRLVSMEKAEPVTFDICTWPGSTDDRVQRVLMRRAREINQLIRGAT